MEIHIRTDANEEFGTCTHVIITKFNSVTIFGNNYTKIVYMHTENDFTIERVDETSHNLDDTTQVVSGPRACEIIEQMLEIEKQRGSTFIWNGARFKNPHQLPHEGIHGDPLCCDYVENENERRERRRHERRKSDRRKATDPIHMDTET